MGKKEQVENMFNDISGNYDFLNHFLSLGTDYGWRRKFVRKLAPYKPGRVLDVATGTGDLALQIGTLEGVIVTGIDLAAGMLAIAEKKASAKEMGERIRFRRGDAEEIPFPSETFDAVTVAFGVRNFENLEKGLSEMHRVLKPGGVMMILEFSHPSSFPMKQAYGLYSRYVIPALGKWVSKNQEAYRYLPESVAAFPSGKDFLDILTRIGMREAKSDALTAGIATIYTGIR